MFNRNKLAVVRLCFLLVFVFTVTIVAFNICNNNTPPPSLQSQIADGKALAKQYCSNCHEQPEPSLIDKASWANGVLPAMGKNLGIKRFMGGYFTDKNSVLDINNWQKIVSYYTSTAPDKLIIPRPAVAPLNDWAIFKVEKPKNADTTIQAQTMMISHRENDNYFYTSDIANNVYRWDADLKGQLVNCFDSQITGLSFLNDTGVVTGIGTIAPVNSYKGGIWLTGLRKKEKNGKPVLIADSLPRPVATVAADFNKDGLTDYIVCAFGHDNGGLYLIQQQPNHIFKKIIVSNIAGAVQLLTGDFNNDGWTDVICLFSQADEGIRMFLNDHKGGFKTQTLLRFPSIYGSSSFQLADFNHDGKPDILYTCGDNSDFSRVLKPYHGVYIFINQGNWKFKQTYFYQINGCMKAMAADFNHDGNLDIAAIAYYADFKNSPREGFTYLEQTQPDKFTAHRLPISSYGRWMTMDIADVDKDGYEDIILGNFSIPDRGMINQANFKVNWDKYNPFIVLKNQLGKRH